MPARLAYGFLGEAQTKQLEARGDVDFAYSPAFGRFRSSVVQQRLGIDMVFRVIKTRSVGGRTRPA
jgi:twitching motility protein PilT